RERGRGELEAQPEDEYAWDQALHGDASGWDGGTGKRHRDEMQAACRGRTRAQPIARQAPRRGPGSPAPRDWPCAYSTGPCRYGGPGAGEFRSHRNAGTDFELSP